MDADSSVQSLTYITPEWLSVVLKDCDNEAKQNQRLMLLGPKGRAVLWNLCSILGFENKGVPGQACRIFERYMAHNFLNATENLSDPLVRDTTINTMKDKLPIIISCCIQLAAKMSSLTAKINASVVRVALLCRGFTFEIDEIVATESKIFDSIGYRVPLWTSVDMGEILATELRLPSHIVNIIAAVINIAEYFRVAIDRRVRWANDIRDTAGSTVCTLHLAAGSVAAAAAYLKYDGLTVLRLSELIRQPFPYLISISDAVIACIVNEPPLNRTQLKRRMVP